MGSKVLFGFVTFRQLRQLWAALLPEIVSGRKIKIKKKKLELYLLYLGRN